MRRFICFAGAQPCVRYARLVVPGLPKGLSGKRLLFATDVHASRAFGTAAVARLIAQMRACEPDMLLLGGDYAETPARERAFFEAIAQIRPPLGIVTVPGNNDWECCKGDYSEIRRLARDAGVRFLVNERFTLDVPGGRLVVTGLDETKHGSPDAGALIAPKTGEFAILLAHSPWALDTVLADRAVLPHLTLCGHTHGGQIRIGRLSPYGIGYEYRRNRCDKKREFFFVSGTHVVRGMTVVVSNGIGTSLLPVRVGAMPEMHVFTLEPTDTSF